MDKPFIASNLTLIDQTVIPAPGLTLIETVQGCIAFLPTQSQLTALLYTPKAPDGIEFRSFGTFVESLDQTGMIDYYKDRCRIKARRILSFFLNDMKNGNANKAPFLPKDAIADFAETCFNRPLERKIRDVADSTTSRHDMLSRLIWTSVEIIATVLTLPFPPASFAVGIALSLRDCMEALKALAGHSLEEAGPHIIASVLNAAGAAGDLKSGLKGFGGLIRKLARNPSPDAVPTALKQASDLPSYEELFPVTLQNEPFLVTKPNANRQAPVFRNSVTHSDAAHATHHFATQHSSGGWHPAGQAWTAPPPAANASTDRAVSILRSELKAASGTHANGVSLLNGHFYIEMENRFYQVQFDAGLRCWCIVDPANPYAFFGRQPVRLDNQNLWARIEHASLRGGADETPGTVRPASEGASGSEATKTDLREYEMPASSQRHMDMVLNTLDMEDMGLGLDKFFEDYYAQLRQRYSALREKLYLDANAFFATRSTLPPRPTLPIIDESTTVHTFLTDAFSQSNGLVLSEAPKSIASKRFLMMYMQALVEQRVEVLYLPHLFTDRHLRKLAKYRDKGAKVRTGSHEIKHHLDAINDGALDNTSREFDYYHLIKEAHRNHIEVRPLSASTSYPVQAFPVQSAPTDSTAEQKMSNYFSHRKIEEDMGTTPTRRWVALVDPDMATTHEGIAGITELQGAISAHIDQTLPGTATRITAQSSLVETGASTTVSDFKIEFAESLLSSHPTTPVSPTAPGNFFPVTAVANRSDEPGFRWVENRWKRVSPGEMPMANSSTALQQSLADAAYELPVESRDTLYRMAYLERKGMDTHYFFADEQIMQVQSRFVHLREALQKDARHILTRSLPPRPTLPTLTPDMRYADFIEQLYRQTDGVVIGEYHSSIASKQFLIDHLFPQGKARTLYLEHLLTDLHQADLDRFAETGIMSQRLHHSLSMLDQGHLTDPAGVYTFEQLVVKAREHGIEVRAIDCAASYHLKGIAGAKSTTRQQMMNYFASRLIRRHQAIMGDHKWVALVGNSHSNTYMRTVPGLAELEGGIGIRVDDVSVVSGHGISLDEGENVRFGLQDRDVFLQGDFKLEIKTSASPKVSREGTPPSVDQRLSRPGRFLIELQDNQHVIVHRSRDGELHRTAIQKNSQGKVFVEREGWKDVHTAEHNDIDALVEALKGLNMTYVG